MSVFGGDSWAREAQQRKRRLDDLLVVSPSDASYSKKLSNGKYACLLCPNNPVMDSPLMLSVHNKGSRHIAAKTRLKNRELSRQEELNKRIALSSDYADVPQRPEVRSKPLIEQTRKAILEAHCNMSNTLSARDACHGTKSNNANYPLYGSTFLAASENMNYEGSSEKINLGTTDAGGNVHVDWLVELQMRQERELKFTAAGWKRDCHGKWYRDENVEFDSDEETPNDS